MVDLRAQAKADVEALTAEFLATVDRMWRDLAAAEAALVRDYATLGAAERAQRQAALERLAGRLADVVNAAARDQINLALSGAYEGGLHRTAAALGRNDVLDVADSDLLRASIADTYSDILTATRLVRQTTKELIRALARELAALRVQGGITAEAAGRALADRAAESGITAIVYRDGSRHGIDDYADMLLRTKTAEIYQVGGFEQARAFGVGFMELLDNPSCGLDGHNDPTKANGMILPLQEAERFPISHPRCVRVTVARPDVTSPAQVQGARRSTTAGQDADQATVEAARAGRRSSFESRAARRNAGLLSPSTGAAVSPAARRAAARVARRQAVRSS